MGSLVKAKEIDSIKLYTLLERCGAHPLLPACMILQYHPDDRTTTPGAGGISWMPARLF